MATSAENIQTRIDTITAELAALTSHPDFTADGISVQHQAYRKALLYELEQLQTLLLKFSGPCLEVTYGF